MMNLKKGEINISFSNHTFNLHLNEGESIDIRLKNDKGNIYMGQADGNSDDTVNHKINGYSSVGLSESTQTEKTQNHLVQPEEITSSIHKILESEEKNNNNIKEYKESEIKETTSQDDEKDVVEEEEHQNIDHSEEQSTSNQKDESPEDEISDNSQESQEEDDTEENPEESTSNILNRYMPLDDEEDE